MKMISKLVLVGGVLSMMVLTSGCGSLSYYSAASSADEIAQNRIFASGNKEALRYMNTGISPRAAIKAVALDNGGVGVGVDLLSLDVLGQHPIRQTVAAVVDAATIATTVYYGSKAISGNNNSQDSKSTSTTGDGNANVDVSSGDNSPVHIEIHNGDDNAAPPN